LANATADQGVTRLPIIQETQYIPRCGFLAKGTSMNMTLSLAPLVSLIAGILILVMPRLLNLIVAIYLIVIGLIGLFGGHLHL
jgi:hypothetical protein